MRSASGPVLKCLVERRHPVELCEAILGDNIPELGRCFLAVWLRLGRRHLHKQVADLVLVVVPHGDPVLERATATLITANCRKGRIRRAGCTRWGGTAGY